MLERKVLELVLEMNIAVFLLIAKLALTPAYPLREPECPTQQKLKAHLKLQIFHYRQIQNTALQVEKPQNGKLNSVLNKMLIVTFSLLAIAVITLFIVNSYEKYYTNLAYEQYIADLTSVLSELENSPSFRIEDHSY